MLKFKNKACKNLNIENCIWGGGNQDLRNLNNLIKN